MILGPSQARLEFKEMFTTLYWQKREKCGATTVINMLSTSCI